MSDLITLAHGAGGEAMQRLLAQEIAVLYDGEPQWEDAAILPADGRIAVTTDSFVVKPLVFPG
ncbi:MAG: hydrogenase expression/formation protein HypE, partial [Armatimonadia bacterium]